MSNSLLKDSPQVQTFPEAKNQISNTFTFDHRLWPLLGSHLFIDIYNSLFPLITPLIIAKYHLSLTFIGFLSALVNFSGSFMQPVYGYLSDRFKSASLVLYAPFCIALACFGIALMSNLYLLILSLILLGTGFSLYHPQATSTVGLLSKNCKFNRSSFISLFVASGSLGSSISPFFILLFISANPASLKNLVWACIPALIAYVFLYTTYYSSDKDLSLKKVKNKNIGFKQLITIFSQKDLVLLSSIVALRSVSILTLIAFISQLITHSWHESLKLAGFATLLLNAGSFFGGLSGGFISHKISPKLVLAFSLTVSAPCLFAFLIYKSILFLALGTFFSAWSNSVCVSMSQNIVPNKVQGFASSLTMGFAWGAGAMIIPFVGIMADATSLNEALKYFLPIPLLLAGFLCLLLKDNN